MSWIYDFFTSIGTLIVTFATLLVQALISMFKLIGMLPTYLSYIINWLGCLPDFLFVFAVVIPIICIIWGIKKAVAV